MSEYPPAESLPVRQRAVVATERPARYVKQLGSHMGRKIDTAELPGGLLLIDEANNALIMEVRAEDEEKATNIAGVLDRHLVRFGERDELVVEFRGV